MTGSNSHVEPPWGFTNYRTSYTPQSDATFPAIIDLITEYINDGVYKEYQDLLSRRAHVVDIAPFDKIWAKYEPRVSEDVIRFEGASIDQVRSHFEAWANERDMVDRFPSYRMFTFIDEESLESLKDASITEECPPGMRHRVSHLVKKLIEVWQSEIHRLWAG